MYLLFFMSYHLTLYPSAVYLNRAADYGLDDRGSIHSRKDFFLLHNVKTGTGAHRASYLMGTGGSFPKDITAGS
jgi:hypothetical protein